MNIEDVFRKLKPLMGQKLDLTTNVHTDPSVLDAAGALEALPSLSQRTIFGQLPAGAAAEENGLRLGEGSGIPSPANSACSGRKCPASGATVPCVPRALLLEEAWTAP